MKILFLILAVTTSLMAETRSSQVGLAYTAGPEEYKSQSVDGIVGISEKWQLLGSYFRSDSGIAPLTGEKLISSEGRLGADWVFHPSWNVYLEAISRKDPYELYGRGGAIGVGANVSDFWNSEKRTRIALTLQQIKFEQDVTFVGARGSLNVARAVDQRLATLSVSQEILKWLELGLTLSRYNYTGESNQLAFATARRRTSLGSSGPTYGLPDQTRSLSMTLSPLEWMETSLIGSRTKLLSEGEAESKTLTIEQLFFWRDLIIGAEYTTSTFSDNVSGEDPATQSYVGGSLGYSW